MIKNISLWLTATHIYYATLPQRLHKAFHRTQQKNDTWYPTALLNSNKTQTVHRLNWSLFGIYAFQPGLRADQLNRPCSGTTAALLQSRGNSKFPKKKTKKKGDGGGKRTGLLVEASTAGQHKSCRNSLYRTSISSPPCRPVFPTGIRINKPFLFSLSVLAVLLSSSAAH